MMECSKASVLIDAYLDRELDAATEFELEKHIQGCHSCQTKVTGRKALSAALQNGLPFYQPSKRIESAWQKALMRERKTSARFLPVAAIAAAILLSLALLTYRISVSGKEQLATEFTAMHTRAMISGHTTDVLSSDRHNVKPWFAGKIDFAPDVPDLRNESIGLVGGRIDYSSEGNTAVLIYEKRKHTISVFVLPGEESAPLRTFIRRGYSACVWTSGGMTKWAVSDLNEAELTEFCRLMQSKE